MKKTLLSFFTVLLCGGCAAYHAGAPLPELFLISDTEVPEQAQALFKVYSSADSKQYFGIDLLSAGIQPIQIQVINPTEHTYRIHIENAASPFISIEEIVDRVGASPKRTACLGILPGVLISLAIAPVVGLMMLFAYCAEGAQGHGASITIVGGSIIAAPTGIGLLAGNRLYAHRVKYNHQLRENLESKSLKSTIVRPFSDKNGVLFFDANHVPQDNCFQLVDIASQETSVFTDS